METGSVREGVGRAAVRLPWLRPQRAGWHFNELVFDWPARLETLAGDASGSDELPPTSDCERASVTP